MGWWCSYDSNQSDAVRSADMNYDRTDQETNTPPWQQIYIYNQENEKIDKRNIFEN